MVTVEFEKMSEYECAAFVEGFKDADDIGVNDWETACPWGCPWYYEDEATFESTDPYEQGVEWFKNNREDILELMSEEDE